MTVEALIAILAFGSLGAVGVFGYLRAVKTQDRLESNKKRKSTLAADAPNKLPKGQKPVDT